MAGETILFSPMRMSTRNRVVVAAAAIVVLVAAFVLLSGSGDDDTADQPAVTTVSTATGPTGGVTAGDDRSDATEPQTTTTPTADATREIVIVGGKPEGGVAKLEFKDGDRVRFAVSSDVADEVHVHGYDLIRDVAPGRRARFSFEATIEGRFEVELEGSGVQIARLEVRP
jgi:hypothetical protein